MNEKVLVEILPILVTLMFIIMIIALVVKRKTIYPLTRGEYIVHLLSKIVFWILFIILSPIILMIGFELGIIIVIGCLIFPALLPLVSSSGTSGEVSNSSYQNSNQSTRRTAEPKKQEEPNEKRYCHPSNGKVSTVYRNNTVVRSDGITGYRTGNYIHYNDGTTGHIVMLNDNQGIIE